MTPTVNSGFLYLIGIAILLLVTWIVVSIPLYFAGKLISGKHTTFGRAMAAAIVAPVLTLIIYYLMLASLALFLGSLAIVVGLLIAILVLSYIYAAFFRTSILGGFAIAVLATIITFVISFIVAALVALMGFATLPFAPGHGFSIP